MLALATQGDNRNVDMLVGDIYGMDYGSIGLKSSAIASCFGKVTHSFSLPFEENPQHCPPIFSASNGTNPARQNPNSALRTSARVLC